MSTKLEEFDYFLPKESIAQQPPVERSASRLLILNRSDGSLEHRRFTDIVDYFHEGDILFLNDTKVFPARLMARKATGGSAEALLVEKTGARTWLCLVKGIKAGTTGQRVLVGDTEVELRKVGGTWTVEFPPHVDPDEIIASNGIMPLPPYIKRPAKGDAADFDRYQTVYAAASGSIAAPTAGFHFTEELLDAIRLRGVTVLKVTLHIGVGTFLLVKSKIVEEHTMHREYYTLSRAVKEFVGRAKDEGRRVVACGTSVVRTLETVGVENGNCPLQGYTELFIYPGYKFKVVDVMITNFHLPRSTPLLLVSALAGIERIKESYAQAVEKGYRFYSYGDSMLIL